MARDGINYGSIRCIKIVNQGTKGLGIIVKCGDMHTCIDKFISIPLGQSKFYMYKSIRFKEYYCPIH